MLINGNCYLERYFSSDTTPWDILPNKKNLRSAGSLLHQATPSHPPERCKEESSILKIPRQWKTKRQKYLFLALRLCFPNFLGSTEPFFFNCKIYEYASEPVHPRTRLVKHWSRGKTQFWGMEWKSRPESPASMFHLYFLTLHSNWASPQYMFPPFPLTLHSSQIPGIISFLLPNCHVKPDEFDWCGLFPSMNS